MPKDIKPEELTEFPDFDEMQFGRNYIRQMYTPAQGYDIVQFQFWRDYLRNLAMSCFKWENVPAGIDVRAMEYILLMFGQGAMFTDEGGLLFAQAAPNNMLNMYYNPNAIRLVAPNGQTWERHCTAWVLRPENGGEPVMMQRDAVMCYDNMLRAPLDKYIRNYAQRLATIDRITDVNVGAQRTPWVMAGPEESRGTRRRLISKLLENDQYISLNDQDVNALQGLQVLPTVAPYVADKLQETKKAILNEAVTLVGVDNTNQEKRERMIDAEATANNEQIMVLRRSRLQTRREFCKWCNIVFDLHGDEEMSVKWGVPHMREQEGMDGGPAQDDDLRGESSDADY